MPIAFSSHGKEQLKRRKISQKIAIQVIKKSDEIILSFQNRKLRRKKIGGKMLEVVTKTEGSRITIITGYFIRE